MELWVTHRDTNPTKSRQSGQNGTKHSMWPNSRQLIPHKAATTTVTQVSWGSIRGTRNRPNLTPRRPQAVNTGKCGDLHARCIVTAQKRSHDWSREPEMENRRCIHPAEMLHTPDLLSKKASDAPAEDLGVSAVRGTCALERTVCANPQLSRQLAV